MIKMGNLTVYKNDDNKIVIEDIDEDWSAVIIDKCMAEKLCKAIMETAQQIREQQDAEK